MQITNETGRPGVPDAALGPVSDGLGAHIFVDTVVASMSLLA
jgi:hypothetical protein